MAKKIIKSTNKQVQVYGKSKASSNVKAIGKPGNFGMSLIPIQNPRQIYNLYTNEFSQVTSDNVKYYLEAARLGLNFWKSLLFEEIRRKDLHIGGVCQTRKLAIASKSWSIECDEDEELAGWVCKNFENINVVNLITDIVEAQIQGVSTFEVNYKYGAGGRYELDGVRYIPNHLLLYDDIQDEYKFMDAARADGNVLKAMSIGSFLDRVDLSRIPQVDVIQSKILEVHSFDGNAQNGFQNGCIDSLIWAYFFKSYSIKDWATFLEKFATPSVIGTYDPFSIDERTRAQLNTLVKNFGHMFWAVIPNTTDIKVGSEKQSANSMSNEIYKTFTDYWNEQVSIRVIGQTLTTDIKGKGSFAAAKVHDTVRKDILGADMLLVTDAMNRLIRKIIDINFGSVKHYAKFKFNEDQDIDYLKTASEVYRTLDSMGYRITGDEVKKIFGVDFEVKSEIETEPEEPTGAEGKLKAEPLELTPEELEEKEEKEKKFTEQWDNYIAKIIRGEF